jgi:DNA polymerase I
MKTWLLYDVSYLAWRAAHSTGELSYKGSGTGVIYGILREIINLRDLHDTDRMVFCFDHKRKYLKRKELYPGYKAKRDNNRIDEELYKQVHRQLNVLRTQVLPDLGFQNILYEKGYEADDLIASVAENLQQGHKSIIVARDADYYQLLGPRCIIWNPNTRKAVTAASFEETYGVCPSQWADVKAIAGCSSDDVKGVRGIGDKTAAAFLCGKLKAGSVKHVLIVRNDKVWKRNLPLVKLPFAGTPVFKLCRDTFDGKKWKRVCRHYGFRSLLGGFDGKETTQEKKGSRISQGFKFRETDL